MTACIGVSPNMYIRYIQFGASNNNMSPFFPYSIEPSLSDKFRAYAEFIVAAAKAYFGVKR